MRGKVRIWSVLLALVLLTGAALPVQATEETGENGAAAEQQIGEGETGWPALEITARAAILMDAGSGTVLYEKNADEALPPASVTKIMTILLIMEAIDSGKISYDDTVTASEAAASMGGSQIWLKVGETMTVRDMLKAICIVSANDASYAMAEFLDGSADAFVARMNSRAAELGCTNTHFCNPTGLPAEGHATSARDLALISRELLKHPDIRQFTLTWMDSLRDGASELVNTNKLIKTYKGITGLKTGSTDEAKYCLSATAERDGMELIAVLLAAPTSKERFQDAATLLDYGYANYTVTQAEYPPVPEVKVLRGKAVTLPVAVKELGFSALSKKGEPSTLEVIYTLADDVAAPVAKGETVGTVSYRSDGKEIGIGTLVTTEGCAALQFSDILLGLFAVLMPG